MTIQQTLKEYGIEPRESTKKRYIIERIRYWSKRLYIEKMAKEQQTRIQ